MTQLATTSSEQRLDTSEAYFRENIARHSKSFALASRILPPSCRADVAVVYAWCRRADDAIDLAPPEEQPAALHRLRDELASVYAGARQSDATLAAFQVVVHRYSIPALYPLELLNGMEMDVTGMRYRTLDQLLVYCYRVAGTVGLMLCHVFGVSSPSALQHAAHLGIAMQLTNVSRDVLEDAQRGRLYLPDVLLAAEGWPALRGQLGTGLPFEARQALGRVVAQLLSTAESYYRSGDAGLRFLPWRVAMAVRAARYIYSAIGDRLASARYDVFSGRAVVPGWLKLKLVLMAALASVPSALGSIAHRFHRARLERVLGSSDVVWQ